MKISNEMATNLTLDVSHAKGPLKDLTAEVKSANSEWKVQEAQLKAAGDAVGASKAKYDGLSRTVSEQKDKVDALKESLANNNTETTKGRELQAYLTTELAKAERQLNSYNGQLEKAEDAYKYQSSGLAKINNDLNHNSELTEANTRKLEAEGKQEEANKEKLAGLANTRESLNKILKIQTSQLDELTSSGDKNSEAYKKQELRVAQMSAKVAEANKEIREMNSKGIHLSSSSLDTAKEKLESLNDSVKNVNRHFGSLFLANVASSAFSNGLTTIKSKMNELITAGAEYNKQQQVMNATWSTLTGDANKGKDMVNSINDMSNAFGQSNDVVNELDQQFYHVFNQKEPTERLTKSMLTMADTLGMNSEEVERLGLNFTHMMTSSLLQVGDFNMISDQLPMFGEKLLEYEKEVQHNSNLTMAQLRKQMSDGKISAQDAENVINELGDKYKDASENMMSTFSGMSRRIKAQSKVLAGSITEPILNAKNPLFGAVSEWVADKKTISEFNKFGQALSGALDTIMTAFGKSFKSGGFQEFADKVMVKATNAVTKFGNYVAAHSKDIINFFKGIKSIGGAGFSAISIGAKLAIPFLEWLGKFASDHPKKFKALAVAVLGFNFALKGTIGVLGSVKKATDAFKFGKGLFVKVDEATNEKNLTKLGSAVKGTFGKIKEVSGAAFTSMKSGATKAFSAMSTAASKSKTAISKSFSAIKSGATKTFSAMSAAASKSKDAISKSFSAIKKAGEKTGKALAKSLKVTAKIATTAAKKALTGLLTVGKMVGRGLKLAFDFAKSNPLLMIVSVIALVVGALTELYKHNAKFRKFVNGMFKAVQEFIVPIGEFFANIMKGIWTVISDYLGFVVKYWQTVWKVVGTVFSTVWDGISGAIKFYIKIVSTVISTELNIVKTIWNDIWHGISSTFEGIWNGITGTIQKAVDKIKDIIGDIGKTVGKVGSAIGKLIPHFARGGIVSQGDQVVMVNDGDGQDYKELIQLPNGKMTMTSQRNALIPLPIGTRIFSGEDTKQIMQKHGIKNYAKGGVVGAGDTYDVINNYKPTSIIPISGVEASNGYELLNQSANSFSQPVSQSVPTSSGDGAKLDKIITLLAMILGVNKEQLNGGNVAQNSGLKAVYQQMARDNSMRKYQSI